MNHPGIFSVLLVIGCILLAGCTGSPEPAPVTPAVPSPSLPAGTVTAAITTVPQPVVTVIRYVSQTKEVKDSGLLFALQVPVEWNVSTYRLVRSDYPDYRTDLGADTVFSVYSYSLTRSREEEFRDGFRHWSPAPQETTVIINAITFDRFESAADGRTRVAYIVRPTSANEHTYANALVFTARDSNRFEKEDFEKVVSSFRYFSATSAGTAPGEEIPLYDLAGNAVSRGLDPRLFDSSDGGSGEDSSSGDSSGGSSSDSGSPGGGGCGCG